MDFFAGQNSQTNGSSKQRKKTTRFWRGLVAPQHLDCIWQVSWTLGSLGVHLLWGGVNPKGESYLGAFVNKQEKSEPRK